MDGCNAGTDVVTGAGRLIRTLSSNNNNNHNNSASNPSSRTSHDEGHGSPSIDPLSAHILNRTQHSPLNPTHTGSPRRRPSDAGSTQKDEQQSTREHNPTPSELTRTDTVDSAAPSKDLRKGVKAVSFLSRLMGGAKKKELAESVADSDSVTSDGRPEGNNAEVFTQNLGFNPRHPQPPAYIKMGSRNKKQKEFDRLFLAQELYCKPQLKMERSTSSNKLRRKTSNTPSDANTTWAMEFSRDGKYLAAAGADKVVRVWAVLSSAEERRQHERQEFNETEGSNTRHLSAPVFQSKPIREYQAHTATILDLSWSKNNFLLSSSMDKTVRLWHLSRDECLCTFKHTDFVPSISFHPKDDRFFLAGSLDSKLRLWSIPDKNVAFSAQLPDLITAVAFTPDGRYVMAGCLSGLCMTYETEGLKYQTQTHVRSTRGQNAKGSKITGIQPAYDANGDLKVLITSNDSRIRLYNFRDKSLELKFRGNQNNCSQIRASLSDDGRYVVCGSEDRKAYVWSMQQSHGEKRDKTPVEMFEAHDSITTVVCIAPTKTRQHLGKSEDPLYDLCNPPPVTLISHAEQEESQSSKPPTENGSIRTHQTESEKPKESAGYVARSLHKDGNIFVTADFAGKIKVFRQDCAWSKRQRDDWDRSSIFSKRGSRAGTGQPPSVRTTSSQPSLREPRNSTSTQAPSDRILTWRQGMEVASTNGSAADARSSKNQSRSISPRKSLENKRGRTNAKPGSIRSVHPLATDQVVRSPSPVEAKPTKDAPSPPPSNLVDESEQPKENPLALEGDRSYLFWDKDNWQGHAERMQKMSESHEDIAATPSTTDGMTDSAHLSVRPPLYRTHTAVSSLSDEQSSADEFEDAREDEMKCGHCGDTAFSARRMKDGSTKLLCTGCGSVA